MTAWLLGSAALAGETVLLPRGDAWRYHDDGTDPGAGWQDPAFDDSGWASGPAPLGYGIVGVATLVAFGDPTDRHPTTWFRDAFTVPDPGAFEAFSLELRRDDGAAVYVNGVEVLRSNLAPGATASSYATTGVYGTDQDAFLEVVLPAAVLVPGVNVVAVEVHNQSGVSSDLVMDLAVSGWDGPTAVVRGPYLQEPRPDGVVVRWKTDGPCTGELRWGATPTSLTHVRTDPTVGFDHAVRIDGWPADTDVAYAVASPSGVLAGGDPQHVLHTPPNPGTRLPLRFWVLGDSGTADVSAAAVRDAYYAFAPDPLDTQVWLMLGDNAYGSGTESEYDEAVFSFYPEMLRQVPLWATIGNHDGYSSFSDTQTGPYFDLFTWPAQGESGGQGSATEAYWSFDHGNVHVVNLDSYESDRATDGPMATWLRADLAATTSDWLVAMFHHPPYSRGSHDSDIELESIEMRENLLPILEDAGVDLVLTGHSHSYERSLLIDGAYGYSDELLPEQILQDHDGDPAGDGPYTKWPAERMGHEGTVEVVAGSSGQTSGGSLDHPVMHVSLDVLGSLVLDVDGLELTGRFLDDQGVVRDTFALHKGVTTIVDLDGQTLGTEGESLDFSVLAIQPDGTPVTDYAWDWGDGSPAEPGDAASHAWAVEGRYTVTVTATDDTGHQASDTLTVNVDNGPPVIDDLFASPAPVEGSVVTLTAVASDPGNDPLTYTWSIDGDPYSGDVVDLTFFDDGAHLAELTVTDDAGRIAEDQLTIDVANAPPTLLGIDAPGAVEGTPVVLTADATDPGYDMFEVTWDFGGGDVAYGASVTHTFPDSGAVPVTVTLEDSQGASAIAFATLDVANVAPTVTSTTVAGELAEGAPITLHAEATDPGAADQVLLSWDFGDGSPREAGADVVHVFGDQGPYEVQVIAEDGDGGLASTTLDLVLANVPPTIRTMFAPSVVDEGVSQVLRVYGEDPGADDVLSATWSFGDDGTAEGQEVEHAWRDDGRYLVASTLADDDGQGETQLFEVEVHNVAPVFESFPGKVLLGPGERLDYPVVVRDTDEVRLELIAPADASLTDDGVVHWKAPDEPGRATPFQIRADDGDGGVTLQTFAMVVAERSSAPETRFDRDDAVGCTCDGGRSAPAGWSWVLLALPWLRRRR